MLPNIPPDVVTTIINLLLKHTDGRPFGDIRDGFATPPERHKLQRWIGALTDTGFLEIDTSRKPPRYFATNAALAYVRTHSGAKSAQPNSATAAEPVAVPGPSTASSVAATLAVPVREGAHSLAAPANSSALEAPVPASECARNVAVLETVPASVSPQNLAMPTASAMAVPARPTGLPVAVPTNVSAPNLAVPAAASPIARAPAPTMPAAVPASKPARGLPVPEAATSAVPAADLPGSMAVPTVGPANVLAPTSAVPAAVAVAVPASEGARDLAVPVAVPTSVSAPTLAAPVAARPTVPAPAAAVPAADVKSQAALESEVIEKLIKPIVAAALHGSAVMPGMPDAVPAGVPAPEVPAGTPATRPATTQAGMLRSFCNALLERLGERFPVTRDPIVRVILGLLALVLVAAVSGWASLHPWLSAGALFVLLVATVLILSWLARRAASPDAVAKADAQQPAVEMAVPNPPASNPALPARPPAVVARPRASRLPAAMLVLGGLVLGGIVVGTVWYALSPAAPRETGNRIAETGTSLPAKGSATAGTPQPQATNPGHAMPSGGTQDSGAAADVRKPGNSVVTSAATTDGRAVEPSIGVSVSNQTGGDARSPVAIVPSRDSAPETSVVTSAATTGTDGTSKLGPTADAPNISSSDHPTIRPAVSNLPNVSSFPSQSGAYVLIDGKWQPLPHNNGRFVQTYEQAQLLMSLMTDGERASSPVAATNQTGGDPAFAQGYGGQAAHSPTESTHPTIRSSDHPTIGTLTFDGDEPMPKVGAANVTLVFIGARPQVPADAIAKYPALRDEPAIELAPLKTGRGNVRSCALYFVPPGYTDFGPNRLAATLETPSDTITVLHTTQSLKAGRYAVSCGSQSFEIVML